MERSTLGIDFDILEKVVDPVHNDVGKHTQKFVLIPNHMLESEYAISHLKWSSIKYGDSSEIGKVPNNKKGVYAFVVMHENKVLPKHGYVMYIGIAGKDSDRSLQDRYKDYLNTSTVKKRLGIARMVVNWREVLHFFFAPVERDVPSSDLEKMEEQLITALMPPFSEGDMDAKLRAQRRAFQ